MHRNAIKQRPILAPAANLVLREAVFRSTTKLSQITTHTSIANPPYIHAITIGNVRKISGESSCRGSMCQCSSKAYGISIRTITAAEEARNQLMKWRLWRIELIFAMAATDWKVTDVITRPFQL